MANTTWSTTDKSAGLTLSGGNLIATSTTSLQCGVRAVDKQITGKFYWEITCNTMSSGATDAVGISAGGTDVTLLPIAGNPGSLGRAGALSGGSLWVDGAGTSVNIGVFTSGSIVCLAVDCGARLLWMRVGAAGNWNGNATFNPAAGTGGVPIMSLGLGIPIYPTFWSGITGRQVTANFGDTAFTGAVPAGFTSGFTAGANPPLNAIAIQAALEHWGTQSTSATSFGQVTQIALENWVTTSTVNGQAIVTQVALEEWVLTAPPPPPQARVMVLA